MFEPFMATSFQLDDLHEEMLAWQTEHDEEAKQRHARFDRICDLVDGFNARLEVLEGLALKSYDGMIIHSDRLTRLEAKLTELEKHAILWGGDTNPEGMPPMAPVGGHFIPAEARMQSSDQTLEELKLAIFRDGM